MMDGTRTLTFFEEIDDINELIWYNYVGQTYLRKMNDLCVNKKYTETGV